jgi:hypothetical protein
VRTFWPPGLSAYLVRHPSSAWPLARAGWRLRATGWWQHAPFLPLPDVAYWHFRMTTFGAATSPPSPEAMVDAARWSLRQPVGR